jgi:REP element-mobilizing transposase RayT
MSLRTTVNQRGIYFITFTCHNWLPLLEKADAYDAVYKFFDVLTQKGHAITGYVIMPNHLHFLLHYIPSGAILNTVIGNGKRFMAYAIAAALEAKAETALLHQLATAVEAKDRSRGKKHEIWKAGFDVKPCRTEKFLLQKLNYIHQNPVSGKWRLAASAKEYAHSSARFYLHGVQQHGHVVHYETVLDWANMYL